MRMLGKVLILSALLTVASVYISPPKVEAAACSNVSSFGAVRLILPAVEANKDYNLWLRLQTDKPNAYVLVEMNGNNCLEVGGSVPVANQWYWQAYKIGNNTVPLKFASAGNTSIRIIGVQDGLKVDKVILAEPDCTPNGFGGNCKNSVEAAALDGADVTMLPPPSKTPISGNFVLTNTPARLQNQLQRLSYVAGGRTLQTSTELVPFDTTLLDNGKHTVLIETTLTDGTVIRESTVIEVSNPQNAMTPVIRWLKINKNALTLTAMVIASIIVLLLLIGWVRRWYLKRRQLHFRGF